MNIGNLVGSLFNGISGGGYGGSNALRSIYDGARMDASNEKTLTENTDTAINRNKAETLVTAAKATKSINDDVKNLI